MGNVYRAHDQKLGRDVAIKTLPEHLAGDAAALARFEREARFVAALNHPNIAAIYGIEEHTGERILVLELVRGETLEQVLRRGPIPIPRALQIAEEVASALESAHGGGIVHRDLKPSNVKITPEGHVKLLDFGIAKHLVQARDDAGTQAAALTREGSVLGTPQYMSPEQIFGEEIDKRTDIWAFGCLLFEMLSGRRPFDGPTYAHLADVVKNEEPDWSALPAQTPPTIRQLVQRCLRKNAHERLHDIADARVELHDLVAVPASHRDAGSRRSTLLVGAVAAAAVVAVGAWQLSGDSDDSTLVAPKLAQLTSAAGLEEFPAWSPDGASIAYAAQQGAVRKLFVRNVATGVERQITSGELDDLQPVWTPDGARILFVRGREPNRRVAAGETFSLYEAADVWAVELATSRERRLIADAFYPAVSPDGRRIAVDASWAGPRRIWMTDDRGFNPQQLTSEESEAVYHIAPRWSPDGKRIVYQRIERTKFDLAAVDVATRATTTVTNDNYRELNPAWGLDGNWIYFSSDRGGGINVWRLRVGKNGAPSGSPQQLTNGAGQDVQLALSPSGERLTYATLHQNADLWRLPIGPTGKPSGAPVQLVASSREDSRGSWSADGRSIAFNSDRGGDMNIWVHSLADGATRQVTRGSGGDFQPQWAPDGRSLVFFSSRDGSADIWKADLTTGSVTQLTSGPALDINPFFSPDGREIVFQSDSSGRMELWIVGADGSNRRQLTTVGSSGHFQRWLPDGWIYFRSPGPSALMRVRATGGEPERVSNSGGAHISFLPNASRLIDVVSHLTVRSWNPKDGSVENFFQFAEADVRIDYPSVSPDGRWLLFDRFRPEGGDVWLADGIGRRR